MAVLPPGLEFFSQERVGDQDKGATSAEALAQQISAAVASELDDKVAERLESIFLQGEESARQFSIQNQTLQAELAQKVAELRESQTALEVENAGLQQVLSGVLGQLALWGGAGANAAFADLSSLKASTTPGLHPSAASWSTTSPVSLSEALTPSLLSPAAPASDQSSHSGGSTSEGPGFDSNANLSKLPEVPAFPFASKPQASPVALSLADALGIDGDSPPPVHVPSLCAALGVDGFLPCPPGFEPEEDAEADDADGFIFCITIEKAEGTGLGLATSAVSQATGVLHINCVLPGGAAETWNWQCASTGEAEKVLLPGDSIVDVNGIAGDMVAMEMECHTKQQLRLMVVRGSGRCSVPEHVAAVPEASTTLRAEACAFVPFSI